MPKRTLRAPVATLVLMAVGLIATVLMATVACQPSEPPPDANAAFVQEVQTFLDEYTESFVELTYASDKADWVSNTKIVPDDDTNRKNTEAAQAAFLAYTGSTEVIERTRTLLERRDDMEDLQARQLDVILFRAAKGPQTVPELVERQVAAEAAQNENLFGYDFQVDGSSVTANDLDRILVEATDLDERRAAWEASKEVGKGLRDGLADLVELRNGTAQALGYADFFEYQVSEYDMTTDEMMALNKRLVRELWPLYRELHTWARYELAQRYGTDAPDQLPAHWLPNRWGQDWAALVTVEGLDLNSALADKEAEWVVKQAEDFFVSLGFDKLPPSFWQRSSLYPLPEGTPYKKNNHASAWHLDYREDIRSLMSVEPDERWWNTTHHELGHVYYFMSYSRPEVPVLLRRGANRGFHEAMGSLLGMASMQKPFLQGRGLIAEGTPSDEVQALLKEALDSVVFIPFAAGTMTHFEHDLYSGGLTKDEYNARWWSYVTGLQGIVPPSERGEEFCDAASKTHINNDPAQYYDYAISYVVVHQLHRHIAKKILHQDPHATNYFGSQEVGAFIKSILEVGATRDWREVMRENLGEEISAKAMLEYFEPLMAYLVVKNEGHVHTLPETPPEL